ncbi:MAG: substrate-binding domain-containing protein, partial [Clostridia bacterium]|nr:substrate-binding domain-containing protein [Clostridia bacterium]
MSGEEQRVTLKMIAEKAGISIGTVDRAIHHRGGVSENSRQLVMRIAKELGYRPNKFARALGRKSAIHIGIVCPEEPREFYCDVNTGIDNAIEELRDYSATFEKLTYKTQDPQQVFECLAGIDPARFDGLAINSAGPSVVSQINAFVQAGVSVITFNTDATESNRLFYVGNDSRQSGLMGGELLSMLMKNGGNVTVLGNFARIAPFIDRFGGFCEYVQSNATNINIIPCSECHSMPELASQILMDLMRRQSDIGGIFCTGYSSTVGAATALKKMGRRDIRMIGYDVTERTAQMLHEGWCDALLYQAPYHQGYQAV